MPFDPRAQVIDHAHRGTPVGQLNAAVLQGGYFGCEQWNVVSMLVRDEQSLDDCGFDVAEFGGRVDIQRVDVVGQTHGEGPTTHGHGLHRRARVRPGRVKPGRFRSGRVRRGRHRPGRGRRQRDCQRQAGTQQVMVVSRSID